MRTLAIVLLILAAAAPAARADANSLFEHFGARELGVGEALRAEATGATAIALNPAGLALNNELVFETSYGHDGSDGSDTVGVSACDSTVPVPGCFYYRYFSADPEIGMDQFNRRAHEAGFTAARGFGERIAIGQTLKYFDYNSDLMGEEDASGWALDAGLTFVAASFLKVGVVTYNLVGADSIHYPRATGAGLLVRPIPSLSISGDALWNLDLEDDQQAGRYSGGVEWFYLGSGGASGYPLRAGVVHDRTVDATYVTGGLGYRAPKVAIDVGARKQTDGSELMIIGSIRIFAPGAGAAGPSAF